MQVATGVERPPRELLGETHLRPEAGRCQKRVDGILLDQARVGRVVDARVEARAGRETLQVLPADSERGAGLVELVEAIERDAAVDEPVQPLVRPPALD